MRRASIVIAGALTVALLVGLSWALVDRAALEDELAALSERLDVTSDQLAGARAEHRVALRELDDSTSVARRFRRRAEEFAGRASGRGRALRRLRGIGALARGHDVSSARFVPGGDYDLLTVGWTGTDERRSGLYVWRVGERSADLVYVVEPHIDLRDEDAGYVLVGPAGAETKDRYQGWIAGVGITDVGDATGDGLPDLALQESGTGSGGCGKVRFLENLDGALRETFQSFDCDHSIAITKGRLVYGTAARPKGCNAIHGCGTRRTWLRWTGSSWVTEQVTRELY